MAEKRIVQLFYFSVVMGPRLDGVFAVYPYTV